VSDPAKVFALEYRELEAEVRRYERLITEMDGLLREARMYVSDDGCAYRIDEFLEDK
jgi:hypothetical protein